MGGGSSSCYANGVPSLAQTLPNYHVHNVVVSSEDITMAKESWELIMSDKSPEFTRLKGLETDEKSVSSKSANSRNKQSSKGAPLPSSCLIWFYDSFYSRLFQIHPSCKHLFRGSLKAQGKVLCKIIGISIGLRDDEVNVTKILVALAKVSILKLR